MQVKHLVRIGPHERDETEWKENKTPGGKAGRGKALGTHEVIIIKAPSVAMMFKAVPLHSPRICVHFWLDERIDRVISPRLSIAIKSSKSMQKIQARGFTSRYRWILFHASAQTTLRLRKASTVASRMRDERCFT